ncbi:glycerophosphodiester phosphodiesterase [Legionella rowbothamii]|uniref:glycerophosphodiester phosphodiesterase n=1 Tax=Legionella rowbothamii TaxID=96229 RepID=UPI0010557A50|nr:glycerophosphodiester phosphodiesterase family protein [Legionella rowbothamii]
MSLILLEKILDSYFALLPRKTPKPEQISAARLIAHRGAHDHAHGVMENTLTAFRLAAKAGCWGIELDVHATADQVLVVNHDPTLKRLWGRDLTIAEASFADLRAQVPQIPTLAEVVAEFGGKVHLFIELKVPLYNEEALLAVLHELTPVKDYHLLSLKDECFHCLYQVPKKALLLVAVHNNVGDFCDLSLSKHYGGLLGHYVLISNKFAHRLFSAQQVVGVGFVESKNSLYRELNRGISWIFTNQINKISTLLKQ